MEDWNDRTRRLLGDDSIERLANARVLVVGLGGVGGYAVEMLARSGVGALTIIDADNAAASNLNRQIIALRSTLGRPKARLWKERVADINPECRVDARPVFLSSDEDAVGLLLDEGYDYVLDCIDTVAPKVCLLSQCLKRRMHVISSMGAGGRIDPTRVRYADLWQTREDGLARAVRQRLKHLGLRRPLMCVCSDEAPQRASLLEVESENKRTSYGTLASIPSLFGIFMANKAILDITDYKRK